MRVRIDLAYQGTEFAGWALQPGRRTVAGELGRALAVVGRIPEAPRLVVAGRTDAGVHARGQVCHVDLPPEIWARFADHPVVHLNGVLPPDVRVRAAAIAAAGFDARFSALWRRYAYRVFDRPGSVDPLLRGFVAPVQGPLDLAAMNRAAEPLLGLREFAAFCRYREGSTSVRHLLELRWEREDDVAALRVVADAFCHGMVRSLVGVLLPVGTGRRPEGWPLAVMTAARRDPAVNAAAAAGLTLEEVGYPADEGLAAQAALARRRREG